MIDLHCHSTVSDGMLSPGEVVRLAHQNGCTLLSLTDHDHTGGIAEARAEADKLGLRFVNGVEISVTWRGRTIHVVGLDFDEQDENLQNLLAQVRQDRLKRPNVFLYSDFSCIPFFSNICKKSKKNYNYPRLFHTNKKMQNGKILSKKMLNDHIVELKIQTSKIELQP